MPSVIPNAAGKNGYLLVPQEARTLEQCLYTERSTPMTFEELYPIVGCTMLQMIRVLCKDDAGTLRRHMAVIDEDGKVSGKAVNPIATVLYDNPRDPIVGNMVILFGKAKVR